VSLDWPRPLGLLSLSLGLFTIAAWMGAVAWREFQLIDVYKTTRAITNGEKLTPEAVEPAARIARDHAEQTIEGARASFIVNSWLWEWASRPFPNPRSDQYARDALRDQVKLLRQSPSDSLGWYAFARLRAELDGMDEVGLDAVRLSYALGPSEGWISPIRLRYLFLMWDTLPQDIQHLIEVELDSVFRDVFMFKALEDLVGPTRPFGPEVMARIAERYNPEYARSVREVAARPD
jgi:hypothetical protein